MYRSKQSLLLLSPLALALSLPGCALDGADDMQVLGEDEAALGLSAVGTPAAVPGQLLIQYAASATAAQKDAARAQLGALVEKEIHTAAMQTLGAGALDVVRLPAGLSVADAVRGLEGMAGVRFAEPNYIYGHDATSTDPLYTDGSLWGMLGDATSPANQFGSQAGEAWANNHVGSQSVVVAVIDEGIQVTHPDLDANIWVNPFDPEDGVDNDGNGFVDDVHGWDFTGDDNTVYDGGRAGTADSHGTHVAGTIGAESNGAGVVGVNWDVTIISVKFLGRNGGTTADAVLSVDYVTDLKLRHGLDIVATNNSWGGGGFSQALFDAIERANQADILFAAAAGNGGNDGVGDDTDVTPHYPSSYENSNIISVAALSSNGSKSSYSNYGATSVDIGAPGSGIYSTLPVNKYGSYSGTSMATPHVTGALALRAAHSTSRGAALKSDILASAAPTASLDGLCVTGGRLDVGGF